MTRHAVWIEYCSKERRPHLETYRTTHNGKKQRIDSNERPNYYLFWIFLIDRIKHLPPNRENKSAEANKYES